MVRQLRVAGPFADACGAGLRQNFDDRFIDRVLGDETDDLVGNFSILEEEKGRDAANVEASRGRLLSDASVGGDDGRVADIVACGDRPGRNVNVLLLVGL